jgi:hypothetical protein
MVPTAPGKETPVAAVLWLEVEVRLSRGTSARLTKLRGPDATSGFSARGSLCLGGNKKCLLGASFLAKPVLEMAELLVDPVETGPTWCESSGLRGTSGFIEAPRSFFVKRLRVLPWRGPLQGLVELLEPPTRATISTSYAPTVRTSFSFRSKEISVSRRGATTGSPVGVVIQTMLPLAVNFRTPSILLTPLALWTLFLRL